MSKKPTGRYSTVSDGRFSGIFIGAFNDNTYKNALVIFIPFSLHALSNNQIAFFITIGSGLFILPFFFSFVGKVEASDYIDSLETKLILVDNSEKLLILDELIPYYFRNEPLQALKKAEKMFTIAKLEDNQKYKIRASKVLISLFISRLNLSFNGIFYRIVV